LEAVNEKYEHIKQDVFPDDIISPAIPSTKNTSSGFQAFGSRKPGKSSIKSKDNTSLKTSLNQE